MDYNIAMSFISWAFAIIMLCGFLIVKLTEAELKNPDLDEEKTLMNEVFLNHFYNRDFAGKVVMLLMLGSIAWGLLFFGRKK